MPTSAAKPRVKSILTVLWAVAMAGMIAVIYYKLHPPEKLPPAEPSMDQFKTFGARFVVQFMNNSPPAPDIKRETTKESVSFDKVKSDSVMHPIEWTLQYEAFEVISIIGSGSDGLKTSNVIDIKFHFWWNGERWEGAGATSARGNWSANDVDSLAVKCQ